MNDAHFIVVNRKFICDECERPQDEHIARVEVEGPFKGWTRYRCQPVSQDA